MNGYALPIVTAVLAALFTAFGGALAAPGQRGGRLRALLLGASAGAMLVFSLWRMVSEAVCRMTLLYGETAGGLLVFFGLLLGAAAAFLAGSGASRNRTAFSGLDVFTGMVLLLHNLPEGASLFLEKSDQSILASAIHNIPEGIAVGAAMRYAGRSRRAALAAALLVGLSEPLGAVLAVAVLSPFLTLPALCLLLCASAGMMACLALMGLFPAAAECGGRPLTLAGGFMGAACAVLFSLFPISALFGA